MKNNLTNQQLWDIVEELDTYVKENDVTDWELNFIADMMDIRLTKRGYYGKQPEQILRLREKFDLI